MAIIIAFFCGMALTTLADAISDYIDARAQMLEAEAEVLKLENIAKLKGE